MEGRGGYYITEQQCSTEWWRSRRRRRRRRATIHMGTHLLRAARRQKIAAINTKTKRTADQTNRQYTTVQHSAVDDGQQLVRRSGALTQHTDRLGRVLPAGAVDGNGMHHITSRRVQTQIGFHSNAIACV